MFFSDPTYLCFMIPGFLLVMFAQWRVNSAYSHWGKVRNTANQNGVDTARRLLASSGLGNTQLAGTQGKLTDHYDPRDNTLYLSQAVANDPSVASMAVAAHEIGHAQQQAEGYWPMQVRSALVPAANIGSWLGWILIFGGIFLQLIQIAWIGVAFFAVGAVFALATLPVEFNASARARALLTDSGLLMSEEDKRGTNEVLDAAAFTYVAALATAVLQVLYYVTLLGGIGGRRRS
jgi:uncharacterized protein